jgi:acyl dehydratase
MAHRELTPLPTRYTLEKLAEFTPGVNYHTDPEAAKRAGFAEPNVGSAQFLACLYEMLEDTFGLTPASFRGRLAVRFRQPVAAEREVVAQGSYDDAGVVEAGGTRYMVELKLTQSGADVVTGTAEVFVPIAQASHASD